MEFIFWYFHWFLQIFYMWPMSLSGTIFIYCIVLLLFQSHLHLLWEFSFKCWWNLQIWNKRLLSTGLWPTNNCFKIESRVRKRRRQYTLEAVLGWSNWNTAGRHQWDRLLTTFTWFWQALHAYWTTGYNRSGSSFTLTRQWCPHNTQVYM